jgi:hypothetical protein
MIYDGSSISDGTSIHDPVESIETDERSRLFKSDSDEVMSEYEQLPNIDRQSRWYYRGSLPRILASF